MSSEAPSITECINDFLPILGVIVGAAIPLIKDWFSASRAERLERVKLHDSKRIVAYQKAYEFSTTLRMSLKDDTQNVDLAFLNGSAAKLYAVIENLPYYSETIRNILLELESTMEFVMGNILNTEENSQMIRERVFPISVKLKNEILNDLRVWN